MDTYNAKIAAGWILYYSDEGYPYYYHPETQESEWAEYDNEGDNNWKEINTSNDEIGETEEDVNGSQINDKDSDEEGSDEEGSDEEGSDEDDSDDYESSEEDEETGSRNDDNVLSKLSDEAFDRAMEAKFKAYLRTPAGQAAAEAELNRIDRRFDKRSKKRSRQLEKEYVRSLMERKKHDDIAAQRRDRQQQPFFSNVIQLTTQWLYPEVPVSAKKNKTKKKFHESELQSKNSQDPRVDSVDQSSGHRGNNSRYDDFNRETTHRHIVNTRGVDSPSRSQAASLSSSETSETDSFSSEDSDVKQVDAPLFSEVSLPAWLGNFLGLNHANNTDESNDEDVEEGAIERNDRGIVSRVDPLRACRTMTDTVAHNAHTFAQRNYSQIGSQIGTAATVTSNIVQQGAYSAGCVFVQVFGVLFERLNPLLENFVETVVDYNLHRAAPNSTLIPNQSSRLQDSREASHKQSNSNMIDPEQQSPAAVDISSKYESVPNHINALNLQNSPKPPEGPPPRQKVHVESTIIDQSITLPRDTNDNRNDIAEVKEEVDSTVSKVTPESNEVDTHELVMKPTKGDDSLENVDIIRDCEDTSNNATDVDDVAGVVTHIISDIVEKAIPSDTTV